MVGCARIRHRNPLERIVNPLLAELPVNRCRVVAGYFQFSPFSILILGPTVFPQL